MREFANPLVRKRRPGYPEAIDHIKATVRAALELPDSVVVSIAELACRDPGCPDVETVIAILSDGRKPLTVRFHVPIPDIADADLHRALAALPR